MPQRQQFPRGSKVRRRQVRLRAGIRPPLATPGRPTAASLRPFFFASWLVLHARRERVGGLHQRLSHNPEKIGMCDVSVPASFVRHDRTERSRELLTLTKCGPARQRVGIVCAIRSGARIEKHLERGQGSRTGVDREAMASAAGAPTLPTGVLSHAHLQCVSANSRTPLSIIFGYLGSWIPPLNLEVNPTLENLSVFPIYKKRKRKNSALELFARKAEVHERVFQLSTRTCPPTLSTRSCPQQKVPHGNSQPNQSLIGLD